MIPRRSFITGLVSLIAAPAIVRADPLNPPSYTVTETGPRVWSGMLDLCGRHDVTVKEWRMEELAILLDCRSRNITFDHCWMQNVTFPDVTLVRVEQGNGLRFIGCGVLGRVILDGFYDIAGPCGAVS